MPHARVSCQSAPALIPANREHCLHCRAAGACVPCVTLCCEGPSLSETGLNLGTPTCSSSRRIKKDAVLDACATGATQPRTRCTTLGQHQPSAGRLVSTCTHPLNHALRYTCCLVAIGCCHVVRARRTDAYFNTMGLLSSPLSPRPLHLCVSCLHVPPICPPAHVKRMHNMRASHRDNLHFKGGFYHGQ